MEKNYKLIETWDEFIQLITQCKSFKKLAFDIETSGLRYQTMKKIIVKKRQGEKVIEETWDKDTIIGISFSSAIGTGQYLPLYIKLKHFDNRRENYLKELNQVENPLNLLDDTTLDDFRFWFGSGREKEAYNLLKDLLEDSSIKKIAQNGKFDCQFLKVWWNIDVQNFWWDTMLASHTSNENTFNSLDFLSTRYEDLFNYKKSVHDRLSNDQIEEESYADIPLDILALYGAQDADITFRLQGDQLKDMEDERVKFHIKNNYPDCWVESLSLFQNFYMPLSHAYQETEIAGVLFDKVFADKTVTHYTKVMAEMQNTIDDILKVSGIEKLETGKNDRWINLNSPKQKKQLFFEILGWKPIKETQKIKYARKYKKWETIKPEDASTDQDSLKQILESFYEQDSKKIKDRSLEIKIIECTLEYLKKNKMINTYLVGKKILNRMDANGFIHFSMKLHGTVSGRLSSSPNVQNLPKRTFEIISPTGKVIEPSNIRGIFTSPPGYKVFSVDLSQAELRIMADYAQDYVMFDYIKNKIDTHWRGCQKIFYNDDTSLVYNSKDPVMKRFRKLTKLCNFGGLYGGSDKKKVQSVNEKLELGEQKINIEIASKHTDWFNGEFFRIHEYIHEMNHHIKRYGWIDNKFGRRRRLPDSQSNRKWVVAEAQRQGINAQIQGTASDIAQCGFIRIQEYFKNNNFKSRLIFTVHDECVGYIHESEIEELTPIIPEIMVIKDTKWLPLDKIKVPLESEIEIFNNRWGD